jgi:hypothetical protein
VLLIVLWKWRETCRNRLPQLLFPNAFGWLLRRSGWRPLPVTPLKKLTSSTLHRDGSPLQASTMGNSRKSPGSENTR